MKKLNTFWQYATIGGAGSVIAGLAWYQWASNLCAGVCPYSMVEMAVLLSSGPLVIGVGMIASLSVWNLFKSTHEA